jgi:hypothetical protein
MDQHDLPLAAGEPRDQFRRGVDETTFAELTGSIPI